VIVHPILFCKQTPYAKANPEGMRALEPRAALRAGVCGFVGSAATTADAKE
jgi:hypothetical protein